MNKLEKLLFNKLNKKAEDEEYQYRKIKIESKDKYKMISQYDFERIKIKIKEQQQELERNKNIIKLLKHFGENSLGIIYALKDNVEPTENEWLNLIEYEKYLRELKGE